MFISLKECSIGTWSENRQLPTSDLCKRISYLNNLYDYLNTLGNIQEVILLGDIFDLHLSNFKTSIKASTEFFIKLNSINTLQKIIYIPGNHDHFLWILHVFNKYIVDEIKQNSTVSSDDFHVCSFQNNGNVYVNNDSFLKNFISTNSELKVCYPFLQEKKGDNFYFFIHGHFFDSFQTFYFDFLKDVYPVAAKYLKLDFKGIQNPTLDEFELYCSPLYYMFKLFGHTSAGRARMQELYDKYEDSFFKMGKNSDLDDGKLVKRIKDFITRFSIQDGANNFFDIMDYFVFGHTHGPEINMFNYPSPKIKVINTGCWILRKKVDEVGSFLIIDPNENYPKLMNMDSHGNIDEHRSSQQMRNKERPSKRPGIFYGR